MATLLAGVVAEQLAIEVDPLVRRSPIAAVQIALPVLLFSEKHRVPGLVTRHRRPQSGPSDCFFFGLSRIPLSEIP